MDVQSGCLSQHGEKTSLKVENFQVQKVMRFDDRVLEMDQDDVRSANDLESDAERHFDSEYMVDIDLKLRSGEG